MKDKSNTGKIIAIGAIILAFIGGITALIIWTMSTSTPPVTTSGPSSTPPVTTKPLSPGQCRLNGNHGPIIGNIHKTKFCVDGDIKKAQGDGWNQDDLAGNYCCEPTQCLEGDIHASSGTYWCNPPLP